MQRIGFIGLGIMGKPMARNLLKAGYPVVVHNRSRATTEELTAEGAGVAETPGAIAQQSDVVITCLPDSPDVESVVLGNEGVLAGAQSGMIYIDASTIAPTTAQKVYTALKLKGVDALDAPVSGGDIGAQQGTLSIMVGGDEAAFQRALPILQAIGKNIIHVGEAGAGQVTKACNQIVVSLTIQAVAEALTFAKKSGVDPAKVRAALLGGFAHSRILEVHGQRMLDGNFQPGFKLNLHRKDMNIVLQTGKELHLPLFGSAQITELMDALLAQGKGELDNSALITLYEMLAGVTYS
ncbi:MAG: 2-hydroxy-3-oxopropionate reductase [Leptolyngbyaceae cyanobacterium RU_5_1]|nr:2-hydroxy-3-oxopropionate reductase [Leptolyngbyaceae cyanobacterium RU_5_1]